MVSAIQAHPNITEQLAGFLLILPSAECRESLDADEITFTPGFDKYWDD